MSTIDRVQRGGCGGNRLSWAQFERHDAPRDGVDRAVEVTVGDKAPVGTDHGQMLGSERRVPTDGIGDIHRLQ